MSKCKGKHTDPWYPPMDANNPSQYYAIGKVFCDRCPSWEPCLKSGMNEDWGMWGGLIPNERKAIVSENPKYLREHGTISRFRQGCPCKDCQRASKEPLTPIDTLFLPDSDETFVVSEVKDSVFRIVGEPTL